MAEALQIMSPVLVIDFTIQMACFVVAAILQTEKFFDLAGSLTFIICTLYSLYWRHFPRHYPFALASYSQLPPPFLSSFHPRQLLVSGTTIIWATRLGIFLFSRVMQEGKDSRFDKVKSKPSTFFVYWFIQGVWVAATIFPVFLVNAVPPEMLPPLEKLDYVGYTLWLTGFVFEIVADLQKSAWRRNKNNKGKFIKEGLWSISRHPNYFGESVLWFGSWLSVISGLLRVSDTRILPRSVAGLTIISPLFVTYVLTRLSGIPLLERASDKKFGHLAEYQDYKRRTSVFVPWWMPKM